ncbi:MAG: hypothetical protein RJA22_3358 [Verrucomicrobiota bacterium]
MRFHPALQAPPAVRRAVILLSLALVAWLAPTTASVAQEAPELRLFRNAAQAYDTGVYGRAEREFADFTAAHPQSPLFPEALLFQARAAIKQAKLAPAIALLTTNLNRAGPLADQYRYRIGEAHLLGSNYLAAAEAFANLTRDFTNSLLLLEASHDEALARFRLKDYPRVIRLLQDPGAAFPRAAQARPNDALAVRGRLLLGEALLVQGQFAAAELAVAALREADLAPDFKWDRQYLLCRIHLAERQLPNALAGASNLVSLALGTARPDLQADAYALQGSILRQVNLPDAAVAAYTNNLADTTPADRRRVALLRIIEIRQAQERLAESAAQLESFLERYPADPAADSLWLTLGELELRRHLAPPPLPGPIQGTNGLASPATNGSPASLTPPPAPAPGTATTASAGAGTNHLQRALAHFDRVITVFTNSPARGKAFLGKAWGLWLDGRTNDTAVACRAALELLPFSEDAAVARFKLGDALLAQGDFTNALAQYRQVIENYARLPQVQSGLLPQAHYQMTRAALGAGDTRTAEATLRQLLVAQPEGPLSERSLLLVGQALGDFRQPEAARQLLGEFQRRFPASPLIPEADFARARTHVQAGDWPGAMRAYEEWLGRHATNALRPRAEFDLAWATAQGGQESNALRLFTNFVAHHPTDELARRAQFWVGQHHSREGDYVSAQFAFQRITDTTNWPRTNLTYLARLAEGRAAYHRQGWAAADRAFTLLINDDDCPEDIVAEALFALADTTVQRSDDSRRPAERYAAALVTLRKIPLLFETNELVRPLVPAAWGRIGECALQLAVEEPRQYEAATNAFHSVLTNTAATPALRAMAEFGLGRALELQATNGPTADSTNLLSAAFDHYFNVLLGAGPAQGGEPDPFWIRQAGYAAARLAEERRQWNVAVNIYSRMADLLEPLRPRLQDRIEKARDRARAEGQPYGIQ